MTLTTTFVKSIRFERANRVLEMARILVIAGATATGKTAVAVTLAERFGGELVGVDSV